MNKGKSCEERLVRYGQCSVMVVLSCDCTWSVAVQDAPFGQVVGGPRSYYSYELYMETRSEGEVFKVYKKGGKCARVCRGILEV